MCVKLAVKTVEIEFGVHCKMDADGENWSHHSFRPPHQFWIGQSEAKNFLCLSRNQQINHMLTHLPVMVHGWVFGEKGSLLHVAKQSLILLFVVYRHWILLSMVKTSGQQIGKEEKKRKRYVSARMCFKLTSSEMDSSTLSSSSTSCLKVGLWVGTACQHSRIIM